MKTTSRIWTGCLATGLTLLSSTAWAAPRSGTWSQLWVASALGQGGAGSPQDARSAVSDLLKQARQAMKDGRLDEAETLVTRAERMKVRFPMAYFGDTPKKTRADLEKLRKSKRGAPKRPSERFSPDDRRKGKDAAAADPFASRQQAERRAADPFAESSDPNEPRMDRQEHGGLDAVTAPPDDAEADNSGLPPETFPEKSPFAKREVTAPPNPGEENIGYGSREIMPPAEGDAARSESDGFLFAARKALADGDVRTARQMVQRARALNVAYDDPRSDNPAKVEKLVERYAQLMERGEAVKETESGRRQYSEVLLQQAEELVNWGELDVAERLANDARRLDVNYGAYDTRPEQVLQRISDLRAPLGQQASPSGDPRQGVAPRGALDPDLVARKAEALDLVRQARTALAAGDLPRARDLAEQAEELRVPDFAFGPQDDRPWEFLQQIQNAPGVAQATGEGDPGLTGRATQALYDRDHDPTRNVPASSADGAAPADDPLALFLRGEEALRKHDAPTALGWFRQANSRRDELDPSTQQRLQDHLQSLSQQLAAGRKTDGSMLNAAAAVQKSRTRQVSAEIARQEQASRSLQQENPKQAMEILQQARGSVERSGLDSQTRNIFLRRLDRDIEELEKYIDANRGKIELAERNNAVRNEMDQEEKHKVEVQEKLARLVDDFNKLMDQHRYAEAEVVAKKAKEIAPDELVVTQLLLQSKMVKRSAEYAAIRDEKAEGFLVELDNVERSAVPYDDRIPISFGDVKRWEKMIRSRKSLARDQRTRRTEKEIEIERQLKTPVRLKFQDAPLEQVVQHLGTLTNVNVYLDPRGLAEEGVDINTPVTIDLSQEISLKSALNLILAPLRLSYVVKNEVLMITSEQLRDGEVFTQTYYVADLVTPIPNFVPNSRIGLSGALQDAMSAAPANWNNLAQAGPSPVLAGADGVSPATMLDPRLLAQVNSATNSSLAAPSGTDLRMAGFGPGGLSGGSQADFQSLIELITTTVAPTTWSEVGGPGAIQEFRSNLSLVISQTQEVHEEIADLLEQLRRLQDLQVTVEARFITLNDNFFERIGVNFDFQINANADKPFQIFGEKTANAPIVNGPLFPQVGEPRDFRPRDLTTRQAITVGAQNLGGGFISTPNLDIPMTQGSFNLATPQFGGFQPGAGSTFGFAILSEIEAFLFVEASQGDRRSNVLQAPKVTLFNGQFAMMFDVTSVPFVISVIPVVGAFAAAQQPVIMVLNEGTMLTVQAVVSPDRRFVRMTLIPFFSTITQVNTFTFTGSSSSSTSTENDTEGATNSTKNNSSTNTTTAGTTVQLPSFAFFTVITVVSVPDGGTVLLGGVKRLNEGRNEFGTPILAKIPYVNRLFKNIGVGRETQSLMIMVTPRIIIQEEEEELLVGRPAQ